MSDEHGSFIMYTESWSGIQLLSREQRGDLLTALMAFNGADDCEMPEMDQATACIFAMLRPRLEANRKKYQETVETRKEGGKLGGRPASKPQGSEKNLKVSEKTLRFSEKPQGSEKNPVSVSDPVSVNDLKDSKYTPLTPQGETGVGVSTPAQTSSPLKARETPRPDPEPKPTPETPAADPQQAPDTTTAPQVDTSHGNPCWKEFCYVFSLWPVQQGREKAWREYAYLRARHLVPESYALADIIERFKAEDRRWKRGYVPMMANWLRDRRWDDVPEKAPAKSYAPDENGRTPYVNEADQDYSGPSKFCGLSELI